jgi:hypothetical protein
MPPSPFGWLCILLHFFRTATPRTTSRNVPPSLLPEELLQGVPACAQPCLFASLAELFPLACTVPASLSCLCSTYSTSGESLGELALGCVYASCSSTDRSFEAYNVCFGQTDAVKPTLTALTVVTPPPTPTPTTTRTSLDSLSMSSSSPDITTTPSTITFNTSPSQPSSTESVIADSISFAPAPTSTSSQTAASSTNAPTRPQTMKPAEIAGLSVAAVATFIFAISLMALSIFLRKRRERKKDLIIEEKPVLPRSPRVSSNPFSQSTGRSQSSLDLSALFPLPPASALRKPSQTAKGPRAYPPSRQGLHPTASRQDQSNTVPANGFNSVHPLARPSLGAPNKSSDSFVPRDQIGLAISAGEPKESITRSKSTQAPRRFSSMLQKQRSLKRNSATSQRPASNVTQYTVFEEDSVVEIPESRRQSALLPTPSLPIPPIRSFQPSRPPPPKFTLQRSTPPSTEIQKQRQRSELFLDIPVQQSRPQLPRMTGLDPAPSKEKARLASDTSSLSQRKQVPTTVRTSESSHGGDIPDYYFTAHRPQTPKKSDSPRRLKDAFEATSTKPKLTSSNVSRTSSIASTNMRDSYFSQTSFEDGDNDMDDPTPEDEHEHRLTPVMESPISSLRYPKVPRASCQLVPRSPRSPISQTSQDSPRWASEPSSLLLKRRGENNPFHLGSPLRIGSPVRPEIRNHMREYRQHIRSNSVETWSPLRTDERSTRTQSGLWPPKSPAMYEQDVVRPLSIRPRPQQLLQTPRMEMEALKSPAWVPRLTPTRHGDDLLISVTYSKPGLSRSSS